VLCSDTGSDSILVFQGQTKTRNAKTTYSFNEKNCPVPCSQSWGRIVQPYRCD